MLKCTEGLEVHSFCCTILLPDIVNLGDCGVFFSINYMFSILVHEEILILN